MRIILLALLVCALTACSNTEQATSVQHGEVAALERVVTSPPPNRGQIQQVTSKEELEATPTQEVSYMNINSMRIQVPNGYSLEYVSDNALPHFVLYSVQNDDTIEVYGGTMNNSISMNSVADGIAEWCIDNYYPDGQPKTIGNSTKSGTTYQNYINFTDDMTLTYFCIKSDIISVLHKTECPVMPDLTTYILNSLSPDDEVTPDAKDEIPQNYTAMQGGHYYTLTSLDKGNKEGNVYILFPLSDERTTVQVFGKKSELLYDTYLMKNSMYYANTIKLKLTKEHIIYTSKNLAIAKMESSDNTKERDETTENE